MAEYTETSELDQPQDTQNIQDTTSTADNITTAETQPLAAPVQKQKKSAIDLSTKPGVSDFGAKVSPSAFSFKSSGTSQEYKAVQAKKQVIKEGEEAKSRLHYQEQAARLNPTYKNNQPLIDNINSQAAEKAQIDISNEENTSQVSDYVETGLEKVANVGIGMLNTVPKGLKALSGGTINLPTIDPYDTEQNKIPFAKYKPAAIAKIKNDKAIADIDNEDYVAPPVEDVQKELFFNDKVKENKESIINNMFSPGLLGVGTEHDKDLQKQQKALGVSEIQNIQNISDKQKVNTAQSILYGDTMNYLADDILKTQQKIKNKTATPEEINGFQLNIQNYKNNKQQYQEVLKDNNTLENNKLSAKENIDLFKLSYNPYSNLINHVGGLERGMVGGALVSLGEFDKAIGGYKDNVFTHAGERLIQSSQEIKDSYRAFDLNKIKSVSDFGMWFGQTVGGLVPYAVGGDLGAVEKIGGELAMGAEAKAFFPLAAAGQKSYSMDQEMRANPNLKYTGLQRSAAMIGYGLGEWYMTGGMTDILKGTKGINQAIEKSAVDSDLFDNGIKSYVNKAIDNAPVFLSETHKAGLTGFTVAALNTITDNVILGKKAPIKDALIDGYKNMALMHTAISGMGNIFGYAVGKVSADADRAETTKNLLQISGLKEQLLNTDLDETTRKVINDNINSLNNKNKVILQQSVSKIGTYSRDQIKSLLEIDQDKFELRQEAKTVKENKSNLPDNAVASLIDGIKSKFDDLNNNKSKILSDKYNALEYIEPSKLNSLYADAKKSLELENERNPNNKVKVDEETIKDRALNTHFLDEHLKNNLNEKGYNAFVDFGHKKASKKYGIDTYTKTDALNSAYNEFNRISSNRNEIASKRNLITKSAESIGIEKDFDAYNLGSPNEIKDFLINNTKLSPEEIDLYSSKPLGFTLDASDMNNGKKAIVVNETKSAVSGYTTTGQHEFLHILLSHLTNKDPEFASTSGKMLYDHIEKTLGSDVFKDTKFKIRHDEYKKALDKGEISPADYWEEVFPLLSESISSGDVKYNDTFFTKIKDVLRRILQNAGLKNIEFKTGEDAFNFIKDYNKGFEKGDLGKGFKKLVKSEETNVGRKESKSIEDRMDDLDSKLADGEIDYDFYEKSMSALEKEEKAVKVVSKIEEKGFKEKETTKEKQPISDVAKNAKEKLDAIGNNPKGFDIGNETIYKELDKMVKAKSRNWITSKGTVIDFTNKDKGGLDGFDMDEMVNETRASMIPYIAKFDPSRNNSLYGYINAQYVNRMRQALKSGKVADVIYGENAEEVKGLMSEEQTDMNVTSTLPEKPSYKSLIDSNVIEPKYAESIKNKILTTVRTLKSKALEPVSINRTITPIVAEIKDAMGKQADIDFKTAMGGKKDNELRNWLIDNKKAVLENMTTTFLMGANGQGGIPMAIEKRIDGKWEKYPEWVGKTIDRESVSTDLAGRTSGAELSRRLKNADNLISNADFLSFVIGDDGNPIRGRKEALAKALGEEYSFDLIKKDFTEEGDIYNAFQKNQELLTGMAVDNAVTEMSKQFDRGNVKFSLLNNEEDQNIFKEGEDLFKENLLKGDLNIRKSFNEVYGNKFKDKTNSIVSKITDNILNLLPTKKLDIENGKLFTSNDIDKLLNEDNFKTPNSENFGLDIIGIENLKYSNKDNSLSYDGVQALNKFSGSINKALDGVKDQNDRNNIIEDQINTFSRVTRAKNGLFKTNRQFWENLIKPNLSIEDLNNFELRPLKQGEGIFVNDKQITTDFDPTLKTSKETILTNISGWNTQSQKNKSIILAQLDKFIDSGDVKGAAMYINLSSKDMRSPLKLMGDFKGYEKGVFESNEIPVYEHRPPINEIGNKFIAAVSGEISKEEALKAINTSETYLISKELNKSVNENYKTQGDFLTSYTPNLEKLNKEIISVDKLGNVHMSLNEESEVSKEFNKILEETRGIGVNEQFSDITARNISAGKGKFRFFVPPSAEDFSGLLYDFMGSGKRGDEQKQFFEDKLLKPYVNGIIRVDNIRAGIKEGYKKLKQEYPEEARALIETIKDTNNTYDQAVRAFLWDANEVEIPGLSKEEITKLVNAVKANPAMVEFANKLSTASGQAEGWVAPDKYWNAGSIVSDLYSITEGKGRKQILGEFVNNSNAIFSSENLNKIEAARSTAFRVALEDSIFAMQTGTNKNSKDPITSAWSSWVSNSSGAIMFLNTRSAVLQLVASTNFINWSDNNPLMAAKAFADQPQYWKDFAHLWNSNSLKERRGGLRLDVDAAELANAVEGSRNKPKAALSALLKIGYTPTKLANSFAICNGGATFYRNRINTYEKQGLTTDEAETKAYRDFLGAMNESHHSSDPSKISQQQRSGIGRIVLAFNNAPMQYARLTKKATRDLINNRGDAKTNISKIIYYGAMQNLIFSGLQKGLFAMAFDAPADDDEKKRKNKLTPEEQKQEKYLSLADGMLDTVLRGTGMYGAALSAIKNTLIEFKKQNDKGIRADHFKTVLAASTVSPPISSKLTKLYSALNEYKNEKDVIDKQGFSLTADGKFNPSPMYGVIGKSTAALTNIPLDRIVSKANNVAEILDQRNQAWQKIALGLGWSPYDIGAKNEEFDKIKNEAKENRKFEGTVKTIEKKISDKEKLGARLDKMSSDEVDKYVDSVRSVKEKAAIRKEMIWNRVEKDRNK